MEVIRQWIGVTLLLLLSSISNLYGQNNQTVSGKVIDAQSGETLPGVNISVKETSIGTSTDVKGQFELSVSSLQDTLFFSFIGYQTRQVPIMGREQINIALQPQAITGEEVVVVGYGTQKKESVIGAIQTVEPEELLSPSSQLSSTFAGKIAGVISVQRSGEPGADAADFWIRGISTFGANSRPLVILDGVEVSMSEVNALPPEVIKGFSVLKDATATSLYGARGANGVLVVNTKTGNVGKPIINARFETSISSPTKIQQLADGPTYMTLLNQALMTRANDPSSVQLRYSDEKIENTRQGLNPYVYPNVDWYDMIFKDYAVNQNLNLNVSGGGSSMRYFINAAVRHDQGLYRSVDNQSINTGQNNMRYAFQNNLSVDASPSTRIGLKVNAILNNMIRPNASTDALFAQTMEAPPVEFPALFPAQQGVDHMRFGNATGGPLGGTNLYYNPFAAFATGSRDISQSTVSAIFNVDQKLDVLTKGLELRGLASFKNYNSKTRSQTYHANYYQIANYTIDGSQVEYTTELAHPLRSSLLNYGRGTYGDKLINLQAILEYNRTFFAKHNVAATGIYLQRFYITDSENLPHKNQGVSGRVTYNYDNRYFTEFNFGYNGSENFASGNRYGFFPSVAVGYLISNERFFESFANVISHLKFRASYGYVGNSQTSARFPYLTTVNLNSRGFTFGENFDYYRAGPTITKYGTSNASWETSEKLNVGLELGLFDRLMINADYFNEYRTGIFMQRRSIPYSLGIGSARPFANIGEVANSGIDLSLDYNYYANEDLSVSFKGTFTYAHNEIRAIDEPFNTPEHLSQIGHPINGFTVLQAEGLLRPEDLNDGIDRSGFGNVMEGDIKYIDVDGDGAITSLDKVKTDATPIPEIIYGFGPSIRYKLFDFSLFFQGAAKVSLMMSGIHPFGQDRRSLLQYVADNHWSEENKDYNALYPRLAEYANGNTIQDSDYWIRDADYIRLKQAEIGYSYKDFRFYMNGVNLLTFSKFGLWDPELGSGNGLDYPSNRVINFGVQLNLRSN